jgi:serine/threonine protein kinase
MSSTSTLKQDFLDAAAYGYKTDIPIYIRLYAASEPDVCFGPKRVWNLHREVGALLYAFGKPNARRGVPVLAETIRIVVAGSLEDSEFQAQARFARSDGRLEFVFPDKSTAVLSSLAHESKERSDLILRPGVTFLGAEKGPYLVGPLLGSGGTSVVYRVKDPAGESFAAKCLSPGRFARDDLVDRFDREAQNLRAIRHPNIIEYVDHCPYYAGADQILVLEMASQTLASRLAEDRPSLATALTWLEEALSSVAHLHGLGMVHRDLAPRNFMFSKADVLKLSDFGTSKSSANDDLTVDISDVRLGSLIYISEEQRSEPRTARPADDVFSLGQLGYLLLTGIVPRGNPPPMSDFSEVPVEVQAVVETMRSYRRSDRFTDAGAALEALREVTVDPPAETL